MATNGLMEYTSPDYKLIGWFRQSRDGWKQKAQAAQRQVRKLKERLKQVRGRRDEWKAAAQAARTERDCRPPLDTTKNLAPRARVRAR